MNTSYIPNKQPGVDHYQVIVQGNQSSPKMTSYAVVFIASNGEWKYVDGKHDYSTRQSAHRRCRALKAAMQ